jgi:hypothetical protein
MERRRAMAAGVGPRPRRNAFMIPVPVGGVADDSDGARKTERIVYVAIILPFVTAISRRNFRLEKMQPVSIVVQAANH